MWALNIVIRAHMKSSKLQRKIKINRTKRINGIEYRCPQNRFLKI